MPKTILVTGAGSGFGEGASIGLAHAGHEVIATAQIAPQVSALRDKACALGLDNLRAEKLDLLDAYDVRRALAWDIDVLFNNAGIGEGGPVSEVPVDLVRRSFETNVFAPLALTQGFVRSWVDAGRGGKIVFTSSVSGLFTPPGYAPYAATAHALEAIAEAMRQELRPFGIKVQTINPGAYLTGFNETTADTAFRWLDDGRNFTSRASMRETYNSLLATPQGRLDPCEVVDAMVEIVPTDEGRFRNVVPQSCEDMLRRHQTEAWDACI
ncbi:Short-chain dehydrogenase [Tistlia consotensis]|uniref:Short-chain dehydrogenase n=1 Tax=Tistlia consotensis USBA 355 TaxID=560819 RepID=A0A1Y6CM77_9PROT|nr:SDR family oxidoreductase [Tistlia consotensis]SMF73353.1 Short-chain dehydrogenase [Tistlia consotensis USBA 355]SNS30584.1 Short-chain dehydrogenase [Tistlia consotensis]